MKHKIKPILYIAGILLLFATCTRQPHASALLQQTDSLLHHHQPDSALQLLFNIKDETSLPEAERMKLVWNKAMAHYQLEMSLLEDSLILSEISDKSSESWYDHTLEGWDDMPAHAKSSLVGASLSIPITDGRLNLGTWQGIYLCEFRNHGGGRRIVATILGE